MIKSDIITIGGGAAGLAAAITAARAGADVIVTEGGDEPGKKLLATGNGRCNFTNTKMDSAFFRGENPSFVLGALEAFSENDTIDFFRGLGIEPKDKNGYIYPRSMQAKSVRSALINEAQRLNVRFFCGKKVKDISVGSRDFIVKTADETFAAPKCIIAAGGKASPESGSDGSIFPLLEGIGVRVVKPLPALVPLVSKDRFLRSLSGVRSECSIEFFVDGRPVCTSAGEIQFTDYGISGIVVFDGSRYIARGLHNTRHCHVIIDFLPEYSRDDAEKMLYGAKKCLSEKEILNGLFNDKLASAFLRYVQEKGAGREKALCDVVKSCRIDITGTKDFDRAQVTSGGADTAFVDPHTMEHRDIPGLYFAGEVLDVDAICGGYNLQWAWSSGYVAGKSAAV